MDFRGPLRIEASSLRREGRVGKKRSEGGKRRKEGRGKRARCFYTNNVDCMTVKYTWFATNAFDFCFAMLRPLKMLLKIDPSIDVDDSLTCCTSLLSRTSCSYNQQITYAQVFTTPTMPAYTIAVEAALNCIQYARALTMDESNLLTETTTHSTHSRLSQPQEL